MNVTNFRPGPPGGVARAPGSSAVNDAGSAAVYSPTLEGQLSVARAFVLGSRLATPTRREVLRRLEAQVRGGAYLADAALIASEMVAEADLAGELRSMARA